MSKSSQQPEEPVTAEQLASAQSLGLTVLREVRDNLERQEVRAFELSRDPFQFGILAGIAIELSHVKRFDSNSPTRGKIVSKSSQQPEEPVTAEQLASAQSLGLTVLREVRDNLERQEVRAFELSLSPVHFGILAGIAIELSKSEDERDSFVRLFRFCVNVCARISDISPLLIHELQNVEGTASGTVLGFLKAYATPRAGKPCPIPDEPV